LPSADALALEALVVASPEPLELEALRDLLVGLDVDALVAEVSAFWKGRGMEIVVERGRVRFGPARAVSEALSAAEGRRGRKLSDAAVATLSVVALHQPVTLPDIERIRGVKLSSTVMDALLDTGLVRASIRRTDAGRAAVYVTTDAFLERFGLAALSDLPTPEEIPALVGPPED
jgi:segregation and condensation protein B